MTSVVVSVRTVFAAFTRTRIFRRWAPRVLPPIERWLERVSGGRVQLSALLVPSLMLYSRGARSGVTRESPLMYTADGHGRALVAGTSFARERHPAWTYNLLAHPEAEISVRGRRMSVRADSVGLAEREEAWRLIERQWPGYRAYEHSSGREVRVFRLTPMSAR